MRRLAFVFLACACASASQPKIKPPSSFIDVPGRPKLMIVGTFHFADPGLDTYKPQHDINILSPERQREVEQLVDRLASFAPTKIAIEDTADDMERINGKYRDYVAGKAPLGANEVYQIGFRLARKLGHERVYGVDAKGRQFEPDQEGLAHLKRLGQESLGHTVWDDRYTRLYAYDDELKTKVPLIEFFRYLNSPERIRIGHGHYLTGTFHAGRGDDYLGVDNLTGWWYDRNLRIFENITRLMQSPGDRVLVLIGAGHLPILLQAAQSSPEIEWIDVRRYL